MHGEQVELPSQGAMVPSFGFRETLQVRLQLLLRLERGAVDALQHRAVFVAPPVGAGHVEQLDGGDLPGAVHVRPLAKVGELAVAVDAQGRFVGKIVDDLLLVGLGVEHRLGRIAAQFFADKRRVGTNRVHHQRFNAFQIFRRERLRHVEIVVETVGSGRADAEFSAREQLQHGVGHHVGGRMAHTMPQRLDGIVNGVFRGSVVQHCPTCLMVETENSADHYSGWTLRVIRMPFQRLRYGAGAWVIIEH